MEVIYWQLFVVITTAIPYWLISRTASMLAAGFWTFWTLLLVFYAPLVMLQLAVAWGTFILIDSMVSANSDLRATRAKLSDLEKAVEAYPASIQGAAYIAEVTSEIKTLQDAHHYRHLIDTIKSAKKSILVLSGWISTSVIDNKFMTAAEKAVERGVNIYIGFGYEDTSGRHKLNPASERALERLVILSDKSRGKKGSVTVGRFNNHQKILIKDEFEVVCGSHNWLSNRTFVNRERSFLVRDSDLAEEAFLEFRPLIESKTII